MLQRYKLRLQDGTLLVVDHDALSTWLVDGKAMVQRVGSDRWLSLRHFLARERAAARSAPGQSSTPETRLPLVPPPPPHDKREVEPVQPSPSLPLGEPPSLDLPAPEAAALSSEPTSPQSAPEEELRIPVLRLAEECETPRLLDASSPSSSPEPLPSISEPPSLWISEEPAALGTGSTSPLPTPADAIPITPLEPPANPGNEEAVPWRPAALERSKPLEPPPSLDLPNLQVLAEEPAAPHSMAKPSKPTSRDGARMIALKRLDREDEASLRSATPPEAADVEDEPAEPPTGLESGFLGLAPPWGTRVNRWLDGLSRGLDRVSPWLDRLTSRDRPLPDVPHAVTRPEPDGAGVVAKAASRARVLLIGFGGVASAWLDRVSPWLDRLTPRDHPSPSLSTDGPAALGTADPAPHIPLMPPPPLSELPVLRLARIDDEPESERADDDIYEGEGFFDAAWLWVKRITLTTALLAGVIVAAGTWEAWLPKAAQVGRIIVTEIDERAHPSAPTPDGRPQGEGLEAAAGRLPHLTPETIALVMSRSVAGVLDPSEVFGRAHDATVRGMSALTPEEAQEMKALRREVFAALRPGERERVHEYELLRVRRVTLPFEDREVLGLFARGARALPSPALERLQALSGKAIAAGLALPAGAAPEAGTVR